MRALERLFDENFLQEVFDDVYSGKLSSKSVKPVSEDDFAGVFDDEFLDVVYEGFYGNGFNKSELLALFREKEVAKRFYDRYRSFVLSRTRAAVHTESDRRWEVHFDALNPKANSCLKFRRREQGKQKNERKKFKVTGKTRKRLTTRGRDMMIADSGMSSLNTLYTHGTKSLTSRLVVLKEKAIEYDWESIYQKIETLVLTYVALKDCRSPRQFVSIILLAIRAHCKDAASLSTVLRSLFGSDQDHVIAKTLLCDFSDEASALSDEEWGRVMHPDTGDATFEEIMNACDEIDPEVVKQKEWLDAIFDQGRALRRGEMMQKLNSLLGTILAMGLVNESKELKWSVRGVDMFRFQAAKNHKTMVDLIECLLETGKFFCDKGYKCFLDGSFAPMFIEDDQALELDKQYVDIISNFSFVKIGDYSSDACPYLDENDFELKLDNLILNYEFLLNGVKKEIRPYVLKRYENLKKTRSDFNILATKGGLRAAPFSFLIFGQSAVAKSTIVNNLITFSLQTMARLEGKSSFVVDPKSICTLNEMDKYHSDYKSHIMAVLLDDLANANPSTVDVNPTVNIINFVNNIRRTAIVADADLKGKIQLQPRVVCATTNVWEKWASHYSQEPLSVLRRFQLHIKARVKPGFKRPGTTMIDGRKLAAEAKKGNYSPDAWIFDVYEFIGQDQGAIGAPGQKPVARTVDVPESGLPALGIDFGQLLSIFRGKIAEHVEMQKSVVETSGNIFKEQLCEHGMYAHWCNHCKDKPAPKPVQKVVEPTIADMEKELVADAGDASDASVASGGGRSIGTETFERLREMARVRPTRFEDDITIESAENESARFSYFDFSNYIPEYIWTTNWCRWAVTAVKSKRFLRKFYACTACLAPAVAFFGTFCPAVVVPSVCAWLSGTIVAFSARKRFVVESVANSRNMMPYIVQSIRDMDLTLQQGIHDLAVLIAAFTALYALYRLIVPRKKSAMQPDGDGMSVPTHNINIWRVPAPQPIPRGIPFNRNVDDIATVVKRQLATVRLSHPTGVRVTNGLFVDSGILLLPYHEHPKERISVEVAMTTPEIMSGKNFLTSLAPEDCVRLHDTSDVMVCYLPRVGDLRNLVKFFPDEYSERLLTCKMFWKTANADTCKEWLVRWKKFAPVSTASSSFSKGAWYNMSDASFGGMCMATHIHDSVNQAFIAGFHLAGERKENGYNAAEMVLSTALEEAIAKLRERTTVVLPMSEGKMFTDSYGIDTEPEPVIPEKSPSRYLEEGHLNHYGSLSKFFVRPKSAVIQSPVSDKVAEIMKVPQKWGPPANCRKFDDPTRVPLWEPYNHYLSGAGNATQEFAPAVLEKAYKDYIAELDNLLTTAHGKTCLARVRKLNDIECVSGVEGMPFVDPMKPKTSMGFPVRGPKSRYMEDLEPTESHSCPRTMDAETRRLADCYMQSWQSGERCYPVFLACTKDEPTKLSKSKVRVYQAAPAAMQLCVRKYFLTLCNFFSSSPLTTECAVGINSDGPAWHVLNEHITKYGKDRVVAGDFAAYDQHMSARMVLLSFKIMMYIAEKAGYSKEDLEMMRGIATEVAYPIVCLNGELIQLYGSNPSGQNLTVYTNSIVNSLYQRCVFYTLYPDYGKRFSEAVALTTYGDDNKMSVHPDYSKYCHTNMQKVYADNGITYTMADKESESVPFIHHKDADFLKRMSRFAPEYQYVEKDGTVHNGLWLSLLNEDSIFKSLHSNQKSVESPIEVAIQCIEGAARDWWFYGREAFEKRHAELKQVVAEMQLQDLVSDTFFMGFDTREAVWMERYGITKID